MTYEITHEQRLELLEVHNNLRRALSMLGECNDLMLSDIRNLDMLQYKLQSILKFTSRKDSDGNSMHWAKFVLDEDDPEWLTALQRALQDDD